MRCEAEQHPGWCLMWSGRLEIGMAARPIEDGRATQLVHFEGIRGTGRVLRPVFGWKIRRELGVISRLAADRRR